MIPHMGSTIDTIYQSIFVGCVCRIQTDILQRSYFQISQILKSLLVQAHTNFMRLWVCGKVVHNKCQPIKNGLRMCLNGFHATLELVKPVFRQNPCLGLVKVVKVKYFGFERLWALFTFFLPDLKFKFQCNQWKLQKKLIWIIYNYIELIQTIHFKEAEKDIFYSIHVMMIW